MESRTDLPQKIGKYEILDVIGRGGMGVVYSARDPMIDRIVAIKTIRFDNDCDDDQIGRLRMEARSAGKLQHPNIVTVYDFGEQGNLSYIVMEYVQGINLSRAVAKRKPVPLPDKLDVLMQVARGLSFAHESGVVHRDMKPSNICVTARGVAKILDFGLARFDNTRLTKTGFMSGTIAYMSPERFSGSTGPQDDIFALGAVAYEFLTYQRAFPGETTPEIISKILGGPMPPSIAEQTGYPRDLDLVILRALDRDPVQRFKSAAEFEQALEDFTHSDEYQDFIKEETLSPQFQQPVDWNDDNILPNTNPYSSARSMDSVPIGEAPTLAIASDQGSVSTTQMDVPTVARTTIATKPAIESPPRKKNIALPFVALGALVAVVAGIFVSRRPPEPEPAPPPVVVSKPQPQPQPVAPVVDTASQQSEVQLATAKTLSDLVAQRPMTAEEKVRFADANSRLDQARTLIAQKDYAGGAALAKQATDMLREMLSVRPAATPVRQTTAKKKPAPQVIAPPITETVTPAPPPPVSVTIAPVQPAPAPAPVVEPPKPTRADLEREIQSFMHAVAAAYQDKDVAFFRAHSLNMTDQQANAIRNSPSMRVDIAVRSISFTDDANASVIARRTDTFAEAGQPPGVQTLVFELRRVGDGWKIVRFTRG